MIGTYEEEVKVNVVGGEGVDERMVMRKNEISEEWALPDAHKENYGKWGVRLVDASEACGLSEEVSGHHDEDNH